MKHKPRKKKKSSTKIIISKKINVASRIDMTLISEEITSISADEIRTLTSFFSTENEKILQEYFKSNVKIQETLDRTFFDLVKLFYNCQKNTFKQRFT